MPSEDANSYEEVKKAVLARYDVSDETHRLRFRQDRKQVGESYKNWSDRLRDHFKRWIKAKAGIPVEELMMIDQFLHCVPEELAVWLMERKPKTLKEIAELADEYTLVRSRSNSRKAPTSAGGQPVEKDKPDAEKGSRDLPRSSRNNTRGLQCYQCGQFGHIMHNCPQNPEKTSGNSRPLGLLAKGCNEVAWNSQSRKYLRKGLVDGRPTQMLVDTGCSQTVVAARLVQPSKIEHENQVPIVCAHGDTVFYPTALVTLKTGPWKAESRVAVADHPPVEVLLGTDVQESLKHPEYAKPGLAVLTRSQKKQQSVTEATPSATAIPINKDTDTTLTTSAPSQTLEIGNSSTLPVAAEVSSESELLKDECPRQALPGADAVIDKHSAEPLPPRDNLDPLVATPNEMKRLQQEDRSLNGVREKLDTTEEGLEKPRVYFYQKDGLMYRSWRPRGTVEGDVRQCEQLVLPVQCRSVVLHLAHDIPMAGHLGVAKSKDRVLQRYYWPGVFRDIANYCRSCEACQRSVPRRPVRTQMVPMPLIAVPFKRIAMDLIGPLPRTQHGNQFILTIVDYATRYPEAIPLSSTDAPRIAKELVSVFARVGIPDEMLTDQGPNFMSCLLEEVYKLLKVKRIRTTPYHPQTDGLVERFNGTLKSMLRKFVSRSQKNWDEYLPYLLFAYREVPQESTGFSPFELLYGRRVRGPLDILKESWTGEAQEETPIAQYIAKMRTNLKEMADIVDVNAKAAQRRQKVIYDRRTRPRQLSVGDEVLVLLPRATDRTKLEWVGPYKISRKISSVNYEVKTPGRRREQKVYHINLLKKWFPPVSTQEVACLSMEGAYDEEEECPITQGTEEDLYPVVRTLAVDIDLKEVAPNLSTQQEQQLQSLMVEFPSVFQTTPGRTSLVQHEIHLSSPSPIRQKAYRIPYSRRDQVKSELEEMLAAGVVRPSKSAWASPIVLVEKKDGGIRFCVDYRKLNQASHFDAYPMPRIEEVFESIGNSTFISTLDLAKGYWQIPMAPESRDKTAFITPFGLFEFMVMPFGLHSAPATFQRTMNFILQECQSFSRAYIDDVAVFSGNWDDHISHLRTVFQQLQSAGLSVKLKKCQFGQSKVHYLGHRIGGGSIEPEPQKVQAVLNYPRPITKKDVRAFLGLIGYYRRFIPQFASVATSLSDLTKKGQPQIVDWGADQEDAFKSLKDHLTHSPVLAVADPSVPFVLQTDASDRGIGAVLSQLNKEGQEHPVAYASRKLLPRETHYAVVEKECLAIVWAVGTFHTYLYGQTFVLQTDHQPLTWLQRMKSANGRLTRWALTLQPYRFRLEYRNGTDNGNADGLSRGPLDP